MNQYPDPDESTNLLTETSTSISHESFRPADDDGRRHRSPLPPLPLLDDNDDNEDDDVLDRARRILYASHCFNQFSEQTWQFCLVLILAAVSDYKSLFLVTSYGLVSYLAVCVAGSPVGRYLDETSRNRLVVARRLILSQNCSVLGATALCYVLLRHLSELGGNNNGDYWRGGKTPTDVTSILLLVGIHLLGSTAAVLDAGFTVAVERDWIVVMSQQQQCRSSASDDDDVVGDADATTTCAIDDDGANATEIATASEAKNNRDDEKLVNRRQKKWLSDTNVGMRQIDLSCKIVAPTVAGVFVAWFDAGGGGGRGGGDAADDGIIPSDHGYDLRGAALLVGGLNSLALIVEYVGMAEVYARIPALAVTSSTSLSAAAAAADDSADAAASRVVPQVADVIPRQPMLRLDGEGTTTTAARAPIKKHSWILRFLPDAFRIYFDQDPICYAGLSLSLLYLNVALTFGGIMTAYLVLLGMGMGAIGFWRGVASAAGLAGTVAYHAMSVRMDSIDVGMASVAFQFLCLSAVYASLFVDDVGVSIVVLIAGVCLSRPGLWAFDIAVTQLMQERIPAPIRGLVGGVQQSMNAFFTLIAFTVGLFLSDLKYFPLYALVAFTGVGLAAAFYAYNFYPRGKCR